jgi:fucose 4-O-acetylase-like acetyltransferase
MKRNRYLDLMRVLAIGGVVYGHWLLVSVTYRGGRLSGVDAVDYVSWGRWVTWLFQVMPVFFLVGGYVNAGSWMAHHAQGETWTQWVRDRALRLLWPTAVFVVVMVLAVIAAKAAGVPSAEIAEAGWLVALQLWFLPVYLVLIALTPVLLATHRRWGLAVPVAMAGAAGLVDVGVVGPHLHVIGYLNYFFVWGSIHQWGFAWRDRTLTSPRWRPCAMAAEPWASGLLDRPRLWQFVRRLNSTVMNVYLWHFVPAIVIAVAFYATGVMPQPAVGSAEWWELRPAWFALLTIVLVPLVMAITRAERPMLRLPAGLGRPGPWSPVLLVTGIAAAGVGLARLAIGGFAPGGHLPALVLAACTAGLVAALFTGRAPAPGAEPRALRPEEPVQPPKAA